MHKELDQLLNEIYGVYHSNQQSYPSQFCHAFQSFTKRVIRRCNSFQEAYDQLKQEYESYLEVEPLLAFLDHWREDLRESSSLKALESTIKIESGRALSSTKEQIFSEIASVKSELRKIFLEQIWWSPLKNALMIFTPILGWAVLLYRYFTQKTALYPVPSPSKIVLLWSA